jgi:hypothetical protein
MYLLFFLLSLCTVAAKSVFAETATQDQRNRISVTVNNLSTSVHCAEDDNVYLPFLSPRLSSFRIEVKHPSYIAAATQDRSAPDWAGCDMSDDPVVVQEPRQVTFYRTPKLWLVGYTHPTIWQANPVPFRVGDRVEHGLDLVQLWMATDDGAQEVLVVYPQDGYWRIRPLPTEHLGENAYGSSFLVGPVEVGLRPFVALSEIAFEPETRAFRLKFARGGSARLRLDAVDQRHALLDVTFDDRLPSDKPFAALRSMYITEGNADAARVAWVTPGDTGWRQAPVMTFAGGSAAEFWLGRTVPSQHNLSAPDIVFGSFRHRAPERRFVAQTDEAPRLAARQ